MRFRFSFLPFLGCSANSLYFCWCGTFRNYRGDLRLGSDFLLVDYVRSWCVQCDRGKMSSYVVFFHRFLLRVCVFFPSWIISALYSILQFSRKRLMSFKWARSMWMEKSQCFWFHVFFFCCWKFQTSDKSFRSIFVWFTSKPFQKHFFCGHYDKFKLRNVCRELIRYSLCLWGRISGWYSP